MFRNTIPKQRVNKPQRTTNSKANPPRSQYPQYPQSQYPGQPPAQQFPQQGAYPSDAYPPYSQPSQPGQQPYNPTDPAAQQEGDRGLMGALGGGAAGYFGGNKMGGHGIMGAIAGAVLGSKLEDRQKAKKHGHGGKKGF